MVSLSLFLCSIAALSSAAVVHPSLQLTNEAPNQNHPTNLTLEEVTDSDLNATRIRCSGSDYRRDLLERSCINAFQEIPRDGTRARFGTRGGPVHFDIDLPFRWISGKL